MTASEEEEEEDEPHLLLLCPLFLAGAALHEEPLLFQRPALVRNRQRLHQIRDRPLALHLEVLDQREVHELGRIWAITASLLLCNLR